MPLVDWGFLRSLELEGRHPDDAGIWGVTSKRLHVGEGFPEWTVEHIEGTPLPPAPELPAYKLRPTRWAFYRRIRTTAECERVIRVRKDGPMIGLYLFRGWENPPGGVIPLPAPGEEPLPQTHAVHIVDFSESRRQFRFWNNWRDWGNEGHAYLPYEYFDKYVFESWMIYPQLNYRSRKEYVRDGCKEIRWESRDELDRRLYGREIWDEPGEERLGWAFVIERESTLEVEDLYVRPKFRGRGYGRLLAEKVSELASAKKEPLRLWVPFADCNTERPSNYLSLIAITRRLGLSFQPCPVKWAAYLATNEGSGSDVPIEPIVVPPRPRCARAAILATALTLGSTCEHIPIELPAKTATTKKGVQIVDRGRGPQVSTSRITVQDLVPYLQQRYTHEQILEIMPVLTVEEIEAVEQYVHDHYEAVMEQDRHIRERNAQRTTPPEIQEIRRKGHAKVLALMEQFAQTKGEKQISDRSPR